LVQTDEERKAKKLKYSQRPEARAKTKEYNSRPEVKAKKLEYSQRPEVKAKKLEYSQRPEARAKKLEYSQRPEVKARATKRSTTPEFRAKGRTLHNNERLKIFQEYSKRLSNSDIPCCNCCGLNSHVDFLALDHVFGRVEMDSIPELVAIGYSSKLESSKLRDWIMQNNFPDGFQILCHNCNFAKGFPRNNGKCVHKK
jgi:hypothetical protein